MNGLIDTARAYVTAIERGDQAEEERLAALLDTVTQLEQQQRERPTRILEEALTLARAGVPVFPIRPRGKQPLTAHGFKDASTDQAQVEQWWRQWPDANLGLPTGVAFDVVDIDGPEGIARMYARDEPFIDTLTVLGIAGTSRDGGQHVYVPVTGLGNKAALYPGIDYRGVGGYVVAPPSIGANGRRYEWLQSLDLDAARAAA